MRLTKEHKQAILEYVLPEGSYSKGILEDTIVGEAYERGTVGSDDIASYLSEVRRREERYLGVTQRKLLLNFTQTIQFQLPDGSMAIIHAMKIVEHGAGYGEHLIYAVQPMVGDMIPIEPPARGSIWLGKNMNSIQELNEQSVARP